MSENDEFEELGQQTADIVEAFLVSLREISRHEEGATAVPLLLLEVSQILFAGARLGAQTDFTPEQEYQPDTGPDPDLDEMRLRLARMFDNLDTYSYCPDAYEPVLITAQISDDLTSIATELATGLSHFRAGNVVEALWWWQFSYVSSWGDNASAVLRALQSVVAHDRLDAEFEGEDEQIEVATAVLDAAGDGL